MGINVSRPEVVAATVEQIVRSADPAVIKELKDTIAADGARFGIAPADLDAYLKSPDRSDGKLSAFERKLAQVLNNKFESGWNTATTGIADTAALRAGLDIPKINNSLRRAYAVAVDTNAGRTDPTKFEKGMYEDIKSGDQKLTTDELNMHRSITHHAVREKVLAGEKFSDFKKRHQEFFLPDNVLKPFDKRMPAELVDELLEALKQDGVSPAEFLEAGRFIMPTFEGYERIAYEHGKTVGANGVGFYRSNSSEGPDYNLIADPAMKDAIHRELLAPGFVNNIGPAVAGYAAKGAIEAMPITDEVVYQASEKGKNWEFKVTADSGTRELMKRFNFRVTGDGRLVGFAEGPVPKAWAYGQRMTWEEGTKTNVKVELTDPQRGIIADGSYVPVIRVDYIQEDGVKDTVYARLDTLDRAEIVSYENGQTQRTPISPRDFVKPPDPESKKFFDDIYEERYGSLAQALEANAIPAALGRVYRMKAEGDQFTVDPKNLPRSGTRGVQTQATAAGGHKITIVDNDNKPLKITGAKWVEGTIQSYLKEESVHRGRMAQVNRALGSHSKSQFLVLTTSDGHETLFAFDPRNYEVVAICEEVTVLESSGPAVRVRKPVIYIYPAKPTDVRVKLELRPGAELVSQYPQMVDGQWHVVAAKDGTLLNKSNERRVSYLFWEGSDGRFQITLDRAFCVRGDQARVFLEKSCERFALNDREATDFITYWLPALERNRYNLVQFLERDYEDYAKLDITPAPDATIRMFMIFKRCGEPMSVGSPQLPQKQRGTFTVVEWGGANLDE